MEVEERLCVLTQVWKQKHWLLERAEPLLASSPSAPNKEAGQLAREPKFMSVLVEMDLEILYKNIKARNKILDWRIVPHVRDITTNIKYFENN